jgi:hypothetical protein
MAGYTPYIGLGYLDVGDNPADANNVTLEQNRFVLIDKEIFGLYSIFGSGVISGWTVTTPTAQNAQNIQVNVSSGLGIVGLMAAQTQFQGSVQNLPPNSTVYIFAVLTGTTTVGRDVNFVYRISSATDNVSVLIASVETGDNGIASIDNTVRSEVGFQNLINEQIAAHKHRGSPTKIDLVNETKNQLPGSKIANVSANQVTAGRFDPARVPILDHNSLSHRGIFTHEQLDSLARKLNTTTDQLLGEISLGNQLRDLLYKKSGDPVYDQEWINTISYIPGIDPTLDATFVDFSASTCQINTANPGCISGLQLGNVQTVTINWDDSNSLSATESQTNTAVTTVGVQLTRADQNEYIVEGFEVGADGDPLSSFVASLQGVSNETTATGTSDFETQGNFSAKFHIQETVQIAFTKVFNAPIDWSAYDTLLMDVKCVSTTHGPVSFYFVDSLGGQSSTLAVLGMNATTAGGAFVTLSWNIGSFIRANVSSIVFVVSDVAVQSDFWVDNIRLKSSQAYNAQGTVRYRYQTGSTVTYNSLNWLATEPSGTDVRVRARVAGTESDLDNALFTAYLPPIASFSLQGSWIEFEVLLLADTPLYLTTPTLTSLEFSFLSTAADGSIIVETAEDFDRGSTQNVIINTSPVSTTLKPIGTQMCAVGDTSFLSNGLVNELDNNDIPLLAIAGNGLPISEVQAWDALQSNVALGFPNALAAVRTADRKWIVCDTTNHRILIYTTDDNNIPVLLQAYCGANEDVDRVSNAAIGITATYNQQTATLWLGFSQSLTITQDGFSQITVEIGNQTFSLADEGDASGTGATGVTGRVIQVPLTPEHQGTMTGVTNATVSYGENLSATFNALFANRPVPVYVAPVAYYPFIWNPVYAVYSLDGSGNLWIANATNLAEVEDSNGNFIPPFIPATRNLQLFDPTNSTGDTGIWTNLVGFSIEFGGSILELASGKLAVAGLDSSFVGHVWSDALASSPIVLYTSSSNNQPSSISLANDGGSYWVSESSGTSRGGRILNIDTSGNLKAIFQGSYTKVNSVQVLEDDNLLVSV